jgi:hypothetical protein
VVGPVILQKKKGLDETWSFDPLFVWSVEIAIMVFFSLALFIFILLVSPKNLA